MRLACLDVVYVFVLGEIYMEGTLNLMCIFKLETFGYDSPRTPQKSLNEDPKAVETLLC